MVVWRVITYSAKKTMKPQYYETRYILNHERFKSY